MSLTDTINNTNTQKENIKTVTNNIDNKLVELGGERAKDLNDVANKISAMVGQYKKIAMGNFGIGEVNEDTVKITPNVDFEIKEAIIFLKEVRSTDPDIGLSTKDFSAGGSLHIGRFTIGGDYVSVKIIDKQTINVQIRYNWPSADVVVTKWIVIG